MALESRGALTINVIDLTAHQKLIEQWQVTTVPYFVVGGRHGFPGPLPEPILVQRVADLLADDGGE